MIVKEWNMMMKKMLLILNPKSGRCKGLKKLPEVIQNAQSRGYLSTVLITQQAGDAQVFAREYGGQADLVACIGGDGTFSEVVAGMIDGGHTAPLGYVPAGSTNDYAASLGLAANMETAAKDMFDGEIRTLDVGRRDDRYFAYVTAFGMPSKASYSAPQNLKNIFGHLAYILEGIVDLPSLKAEHVRIEMDGEVIEGDYLMGTISNTTSIGGILQFDPDDVLLNDGLLEVMLVSQPANLKDISGMLAAIGSKKYSECSCVTFRKTRTLKIVSENPMPWTVDGEFVEGSCEVEISAVPAAIRVVVPKENRRRKTAARKAAAEE